MSNLPIALQLYSVREACASDLPGTLREVAAMGYDGVEFAGYFGNSAEDLKKMLVDNGLRVAGTHLGIDTLLGDELNKTVEFNQALGNKFLIVPGLPESYRDSLEAWKRTAGVFNDIAARLTPHGMFTGYHNHSHEFTAEDGQTPWDVLLDNTSDAVVIQADTGNALAGKTNITPTITKYPGRAMTVHLKEHSPTNELALIGEGDVDWPALFTACETVGGTEWYIVEQESYPVPPMESAQRCLTALRKMGK